MVMTSFKESAEISAQNGNPWIVRSPTLQNYIDLFLAPDGHAPGAHVHPAKEERFEVMSGTMKFRLGLKKIIETEHGGDG